MPSDYPDNSGKSTRVMKATRLLQAKVGKGTVGEKKVKKSQKIIDNNTVDFVPMADEYLATLAIAIEQAKNPQGASHREALEAMAAPVMQLKGNAAMFDYPLVSNLAGTMLNLLEAVESVDQHVIEIAEAHHKTLRLIIGNRMTGTGGKEGRALQRELKNACKRYFAKRPDISAVS